jgi:hypothetical protein
LNQQVEDDVDGEHDEDDGDDGLLTEDDDTRGVVTRRAKGTTEAKGTKGTKAVLTVDGGETPRPCHNHPVAKFGMGQKCRRTDQKA